MKKFKEFGIKPISQSFTGDKIKIARLLNRAIIIYDFRVEDSKFGSNNKCLYLQIAIDETKHVVFTSSVALTEMIQRVPKTDFPFEATIIIVNCSGFVAARTENGKFFVKIWNTPHIAHELKKILNLK